MQFIHPATQEQLKSLQEILDANPEPGIVDIFVDCGPYSSPYYIVAEDGGSIAGVAGLNCGDGFCELYKLYVPPSSRGKGVGTALVVKVIEVLKQKNVITLAFEMADGSLPFWSRFAETYPLERYYGNKFFYHLP